jgi:hypothetical protein
MKPVGASAWILRPTEALVREAVDALRDVFLESVDAGAQDVVVDLSGVDAVAPSGAETIHAMADLMRGRNATLWLAASRPDLSGYALRAITKPGRSQLLGVSKVLDAAFAQLPVEDGPQRGNHLRKPSHAPDLAAIDLGAPLRRRS